ncbi:CDP-diacylglycerol--serine O-phosphatidyltransferase [Planomonospora sp. ID91781]|nr:MULTISPECIES: CDP-diacylglycerol--serine O-phosphatidyltransferase [Planomonospora]MBG0823964.1 CDP-diacylglycerol--serine O-phosphatidyltransferase [Planomonospora sp. ID91781]
MTAADAGWSMGGADDEPQGPVGKAFRLSAADSLSLGNALCGFLAVCVLAWSAITSLQQTSKFEANPQFFGTAVVLLLLGATCDLFDGLVARRFRASAMGAELDNLADVISFGFAPAFMVVIWGGFNPRVPFLMVMAAAASVLLAGVIRLARFACVKTKSGDFMGLPIPMGAMTVIAIVLLFEPSVGAVLPIFGIAYLMVSRIEYPKPKGNVAAVVLAWMMINVACLTIWAAGLAGGDTLIKVGAVMQITIVAAIPLRILMFKREQRKERKESERVG